MATNQELSSLLNQICTSLLEGELWHERAGNEARKVALRGFGRWHDTEVKGDLCTRMCLEKLCRDKLGYAPIIDATVATRGMSVTLNGISDLSAHLQSWMGRENAFAEKLMAATRIAATVDMDIYKELMCLTTEVQAEAMRVKLCGMRLEAAGWSGHDVMIVSMILHGFFEKHDGDDVKYVNVNLG